MKRIPLVRTHPPRIAAPALVLLLAACGSHTLLIHIDPGATEAAGTAIVQSTSALAGPTQTATAAQPTTPAGSVPTATGARPTAGGEWLLVKTEQGIWMGRPDGSQAGIRIPGKVIIPGPLSGAVSPYGGYFAYITTSDPSRTGFPFGSFPDLKLNIVPLPDGGTSVQIPLTSPATEPDPNFPSEIQRAMIEQTSFAWSPDGNRLAFIGAQEGSSADLYEYYRGSGEVVRLTDGPDQAYRPVWSPGGEWIVHGAARQFSRVSGFGIDVSGFYAAHTDSGGVFSLYEVAEDSGDEVVAGWLDGHTLVARSWLYTCGPNDLRLVDLAAQQSDLVFEGCLSAVAVGPGVVLYGQSYASAGFDEDAPLGIYLLTPTERTPRKISGENTLELVWAEGAGVFLARTWEDRLLEASPAGEIRTLPATAYLLPTVSPNGRWWAYRSDWVYNKMNGVFVAEYGTEFRQIFDGEIAANGMLFSPDGESLYFVTAGGGLYLAQPPDWAPILLAAGLTLDHEWTDMAWWEGG